MEADCRWWGEKNERGYGFPTWVIQHIPIQQDEMGTTYDGADQGRHGCNLGILGCVWEHSRY